MSSWTFIISQSVRVAAAGKEKGPFRRSTVPLPLVKEEMGGDVTVKREGGSSTALYIQTVTIKNKFIDKI
jgi:hypothetical protein